MMDIIALGPAGFKPWLREAMRALAAHVRERDGQLSTDIVSAYFERQELVGYEPYSDVVASGSPIYVPILQRSLALAQIERAKSVLDFGCGRGDLLPLIRNSSSQVHYVGYDQNHLQIKRLQGLVKDACEFVSDAPTAEFDVVCAVNVLCYTNENDLSSFITRLVHAVRPGGRLILADPWPAWYWETKFDGIRLQLRPPNALDDLLSDTHLSCEDLSLASLSRLGTRPLVPIAWSTTWTRRDVP